MFHIVTMELIFSNDVYELLLPSILNIKIKLNARLDAHNS